MNLASTIMPKSDQTNADDLIVGPRTIKITEVKAGSTPEQPVSIHYEGDNNRPYKPNKSMRRVLVSLWGEDPSAYIGRRITIFRNPTVRFGPDETGGIQISHLSDIDGPKTLALTVTRGKRKPYQVLPLEDAPTPARDLSTLEDIASTKIAEGNAALVEWGKTLTVEEKKMIGKNRWAEYLAKTV